MTRLTFSTIAMLLSAGALAAQDISGDWQGTLKAGQDLRLVVTIGKDEHGAWKAMLYSLDQGSDGTRASSVALDGSKFKLTVDAIGGSYEGTLNAEGTVIKGAWKQGGVLPLDLARPTKETAWKHGGPAAANRFVTVDKDVKLEVIDWGGAGRPVVFLAGLGNTAHVFDDFAPKLTGYHCYGITRRGFGESSSPAPIAANYMADRLGDDVLAVIDALKLDRPVLVGHSIAGEELSSVGSRHPEKVAGLIYLDAGYGYAFYNRAQGDLTIDSIEVIKQLEQLQPGRGPQNPKLAIDQLMASLPQLEKELQQRRKDLEGLPDEALAQPPAPALPTPSQAILAGQQKYWDIKPPVLAIFALPHDTPPQLKNDPKAAALEARELAVGGAQVDAFEKGIPTAHVVRIAHANHYLMRTNEADVLREMNAFLAGLK